MSRRIIDTYRKIAAAEEGTRRGGGGRPSVCLLYPNRYSVGMSNLGFQAVYALLSDAGLACERAFLPDGEEMREYRRTGTPLLTLETGKQVRNFDVVAFSVSFESDYLNIPAILELAKVPPLAAERTPSHPLVIAGGAALFLNPEPVANFLDLACIGEAEPLLPSLLELLRGEGDRESLLEKAATTPGLYVPSRYRLGYDGARLAERSPLCGAAETVERAWCPLQGEPTSSVILAPGTEFSDMYLVEVSRGCPRGCRFCAAGFIYRPYRTRPLEELEKAVLHGLKTRGKIGLVGAAVSDHPGIGRLCARIVEEGGKVSVSSLRIDALDEEMLQALISSGHKTVAIAPEGGSQRLRELIRKNLTEEQILQAADRLTAAGILNLKLYFIIGLPTETMDDLEELVSLVERVRERVLERARANRRLGEILLSVNPFIPKPFTPFQWRGMEPVKSLEAKGDFLRRRLARLPNVRMQMESPREAWLQALLSRGDRRLSAFLLEASGGSWKRAMKANAEELDRVVHRDIPLQETLPWDFIEHDRGLLEREYRAAFS